MAYSSQTTLNALYGSANINLWGDPDGSESAATITARCTTFIAYADAYIDARLLLSPLSNSVPFSSTPTLVEYISAALAGGMMYEAFGVRDTAPQKEGRHQLSYQMDRARELLEMIAAGNLDLAL